MPHVHTVFFTLNDPRPAKRDALVRECYEYLEGHAGVVSFSAGVRAEGCTREVNDTRFEVSLHMVFADDASHDAYQTAPRHAEFIARNSSNWKQVRVFDSTIDAR